MPTQTQPFAAAVAFLLLFLYPIRITGIVLPFIVLTAVIGLYVVISLFVYPQLGGPIVANAGAYISPLVLFVALHDKLRLLSPWPLFAALGIWIVVGAIQAFPVPDAIKGAMQALGRLMLERFVSDQYSIGGRGYSLLGSEPSISAPTVILMLLSIGFLYREGKITRTAVVLCFCGASFLVFLNRSGTIGVLIALAALGWMIGAFVRSNPARRLIIFSVGSGLMLAGGAALLSLQIESVRVAVVFTQIVQYISAEQRTDLITLAVVLGSERVIPLVLGYGSLIDNYGLGHGIASWYLQSVLNHVSAVVGINAYDYYQYIGGEIDQGVQNKPQSYFSLIAFDTGFVGLVPLIWGVFNAAFHRGKVIGKWGDGRLVYVLPAVVWLIFFGLSTLPAPWILIAYSLHVIRAPRMNRPWPFRIKWRSDVLEASVSGAPAS